MTRSHSSMADIKLVEATKLFYNEYPYKITYLRLARFPSETVLRSMNFTLLLDGEDYGGWWGDIPKTDEEKQRRTNCVTFLKSLGDVKFAHSAFTHVYFKEEDSFQKACSRYVDLQTEHHVPIIENLGEVINGFNANIDLKKSLYHKKYRYKVTLKFDRHLEEKLGPSLYEMYKDDENYYLNPNVKKFDGATHARGNPYGTYRYVRTFRHSIYNTYAVYCLERIDMEMLTFVAGENISKITKAILIDEIDK